MMQRSRAGPLQAKRTFFLGPRPLCFLRASVQTPSSPASCPKLDQALSPPVRRRFGILSSRMSLECRPARSAAQAHQGPAARAQALRALRSRGMHSEPLHRLSGLQRAAGPRRPLPSRLQRAERQRRRQSTLRLCGRKSVSARHRRPLWAFRARRRSSRPSLRGRLRLGGHSPERCLFAAAEEPSMQAAAPAGSCARRRRRQSFSNGGGRSRLTCGACAMAWALCVLEADAFLRAIVAGLLRRFGIRPSSED